MPRSLPRRPQRRTKRRAATRRCIRPRRATNGTLAKAHIGVDVASGLVHTVTGTAANEADIAQTAALLHGEEEDVFGDAGYTGADKRPELVDREVSPAFAGAGCGTSRSSAASSRLCRQRCAS